MIEWEYLNIYDSLNIKGVEILRGARSRVGFAMFFSFDTKKASCIFFNVGTSTRFVWDGIGILENECGQFGENER